MRRVYDDPSPADGTRVLVDRIWPRGLAKATARIDEWAKVVAHPTELRRWYGPDPSEFDRFRHRYTAELGEPDRQAAVQYECELARSGPLTVLTVTRNVTTARPPSSSSTCTAHGERRGPPPVLRGRLSAIRGCRLPNPC
jgi:uncharacterized protein YeaO (DUF488 family)